MTTIRYDRVTRRRLSRLRAADTPAQARQRAREAEERQDIVFVSNAELDALAAGFCARAVIVAERMKAER